MKKQSAILFVATLLLLSTACDTTSNVTFKGDRASLSEPVAQNLSSSIVATDGGFMIRRTPSNYETSLTVGSQLSNSAVTTSGGYKVQLNFQGQTVTE